MRSHLLESSIEAALSAIEIYNKPRIAYREQSFSILLTNAWELLFKAKLLLDSGDSVECLYAKRGDGLTKTSRSGLPLTLDLFAVARQLGLPRNVLDNVTELVEIRDTVVHLYASEPLSCIVFSLGTASLRNYQTLIRDWFQRSLAEFDFCILPLGFDYRFVSLASLDPKAHPESIGRILETILKCQRLSESDSRFPFACDIQIEVRAAKGARESADLSVTVGRGDPDDAPMWRDRNLIETYPLSYPELTNRIKAELPRANQTHINDAIRKHAVKKDLRYAAPNWRTKKQKEQAETTNEVPKAVPYLYKPDAVRFLVALIRDEVHQRSDLQPVGSSQRATPQKG